MDLDVSERVADTYEKWSEASTRWVQLLAVGNGGGAVLVGGVLKDAKGVWWLAALPSAWLFVAGLLAAGAAVFFGRKEKLARHMLVQAIHWHQIKPEKSPEDHKAELAGHKSKAERAEKVGKWLEAASAAFFLFAVTWPIFVLTVQPLCAR